MPDGLWGIAIRELTPASRLEFLRLKWISGEPKQPHYFWESDVAKWVEGLWYAIDKNAHTDERRLQSVACIDEPVKLIEGAQLPDVYINVYYTVVEPTQRWTNVIKTHELYCAGHLLEAAVLHFTVTQSTRFLDVMCRYVDYIGSFFGPGEGQLHGYPGHQELELALMRLYKVLPKQECLELAEFFVEERGKYHGAFFDDRSRGGSKRSQIKNHRYWSSYRRVLAHGSTRAHPRAENHPWSQRSCVLRRWSTLFSECQK